MKKASLILVLIFSVICNVSFAHGRHSRCCKKVEKQCCSQKAKSCSSEAASCGKKSSCESKATSCGSKSSDCCTDRNNLARDHAKCCGTFHDGCNHSCQYCPKENNDNCSRDHHGCDYCYSSHG